LAALFGGRAFTKGFLFFFMFRSRPIQYLGLLLLLLASLFVIFFPVGPAPKEQAYTVHLTVPKPFKELVGAKKDPAEEADKAFTAQFKTERLPGAMEIMSDGVTAEVADRATTRDEAKARADRIVQSLSRIFKGVQLGKATSDEIASLPVRPIFALGKEGMAVFPMQQGTSGPVPAIKLGLDLQGGVNLVLQIRRALFAYQIDKPLPENIEVRDKFITQVRDALSKAPEAAGLAQADVVIRPLSDNIIEVRTQAKDKAQFEAQKTAIAAALQGVGGYRFSPAGEPQFFQPDAAPGEQFNQGSSQDQVLNQTLEIVRARVDKLGVSEPVIQKQPPDRIIVQLPGVNDPQKAVEQVGRTAQLQIRLLAQNVTVDQNNPDNTLFFDDRGNEIPHAEVASNPLYSTPIIRGNDLKPNTTAGFMRDQKPAIFFELQPQAARRFGEVTAQNVNRFMPIFLDERCISAPTINEPITQGSGQISGGFETIKEAQDLANLLNSGALPAPLDVVENRTVSATLGASSLRQSLNAGLIGIIAVMVFMIFYYRLPGMLANFALLIYCVLNLAAFILIGGTLTLPGIAGFLLALAMSLDTNILVFERLKEEMAVQPTFSAALRAAFSRAWTAILDSHVTTLCAAAVLFYLGTGPVKGFALTLAIGVLLSLFSAISVTRLFMWSVSKTGETNRSLFANAVQSSATIAAQKQ
jgi:protein-export membrane protein SecD